MKKTLAAVMCSTALFAGACSAGDEAGSADGGSGKTVTVTVVDMAYEPASVTINPGDTVVWQWEATLPHDVVSDDESSEVFASELQTSGEYSYTFPAAGDYTYHCTPHPQMTGEVIVAE